MAFAHMFWDMLTFLETFFNNYHNHVSRTLIKLVTWLRFKKIVVNFERVLKMKKTKVAVLKTINFLVLMNLNLKKKYLMVTVVAMYYFFVVLLRRLVTDKRC